jgi:hypothetical protein
MQGLRPDPSGGRNFMKSWRVRELPYCLASYWRTLASAGEAPTISVGADENSILQL